MAESEKKYVILVTPDGRKQIEADDVALGANDCVLTITLAGETVCQVRIWHSWHWKQENEPDYRVSFDDVNPDAGYGPRLRHGLMKALRRVGF